MEESKASQSADPRQSSHRRDIALTIIITLLAAAVFQKLITAPTGSAEQRLYQSAARIVALRRGIALDEGLARAARVSVARGAHGSTLHMVLQTGWKRQVRRMCAAVGLRVLRLRRVRLGPLELGRLRPGAWRELTTREVRALGET